MKWPRNSSDVLPLADRVMLADVGHSTVPPVARALSLECLSWEDVAALQRESQAGLVLLCGAKKSWKLYTICFVIAANLLQLENAFRNSCWPLGNSGILDTCALSLRTHSPTHWRTAGGCISQYEGKLFALALCLQSDRWDHGDCFGASCSVGGRGTRNVATRESTHSFDLSIASRDLPQP